MNIMIVGCGKIGATLADQLSRESYDVTVIDQDRERLQAVIDSSDVIGCAGNGTSFQLLQEAGIANVDVLIAVTGQDEVNLLCCVIAKQTGRDIATIARVQDFTYFKESAYLRARLGISMIINPELTAATEISRLLRTPEAIEISHLCRGPHRAAHLLPRAALRAHRDAAGADEPAAAHAGARLRGGARSGRPHPEG